VTGVLLQARWRHVLPSPLLLHIIGVGERLLGVHTDAGHVAGMHGSLRHRRPVGLGRQVGARRLFGRVNRVGVVYTIVVPGGGLGRVQACLNPVLVAKCGCMVLVSQWIENILPGLGSCPPPL
jgi:hypothetical protein